MLGAEAGSNWEDFASEHCAQEGDSGGSSPSPCLRERDAGCTAFLLPHRPVPRFLLQVAAVGEVGSGWSSAAGLSIPQTLLGGREMGGAAWCSLLVIAKNPPNLVASQLGGSWGCCPPLGVLLSHSLGVHGAQGSAGRGCHDVCRQANVLAPGIPAAIAVQGDLVAMTSCTSIIWEKKRPWQCLLEMGAKQPAWRAHTYHASHALMCLQARVFHRTC